LHFVAAIFFSPSRFSLRLFHLCSRVTAPLLIWWHRVASCAPAAIFLLSDAVSATEWTSLHCRRVDTPPSWSGLLQLAVVIVAASIVVGDCSDRGTVAETPSPSCRTSDRDRASGSIYFLLHWLGFFYVGPAPSALAHLYVVRYSVSSARQSVHRLGSGLTV
jgi:hypothetical protein